MLSGMNNDGNSLAITRGTMNDAEQLVALYHSMIGTPGCTWSKLYPALENVEWDVENGALWVMRDGDTIAGAVSVGNLGDVCDLGWAPKNPAELARLAVAQEYQGRGLANTLVAHAIAVAREAGNDGVVLLVSPGNAKAQHLYQKFGFQPDGEIFAWDHQWLRYQLPFAE